MAQQEVQNGGAESLAAESAVVFTAVKPQLLVEAEKGNDAVQFYKAAFGAAELSRATNPKRKADQALPLFLSAELSLAGSTFVVSAADDDSKKTVGSGNGVVLCLETDDVVAAVGKAVAAGAESHGEILEGEGACCGEREGKVTDPFGYVWQICTPAKKCGGVEA